MSTPIEKKKAVLSPDEVRAALDGLTDAGWVRMRVIARIRARVTRLAPDELLNTAVERLLSGERTCPTDLPIEVVISSSMRSIANGEANGAATDPLAHPDDLQTLDLAPEPAMVNVPEAGALAEKQLKEIFAHFEGDQVAKDVLTAKGLGMSPADTRAELKIDETTYATTLRRIARHLATQSFQEK